MISDKIFYSRRIILWWSEASFLY